MGCIFGKKYGEPFVDPVRICSLEKALSAEQLIDLGDPIRPVMDCIEQLYTRYLVHSRVVSLYFITKSPTAIITVQGFPAGAQLTWLSEEVSKAESLLA